MGDRSIFIGYEPRELDAFIVARESIVRQLTQPIAVHPLILDDLRGAGWYTRYTILQQSGQLWDAASDAPMSTEFAISRFFTPVISTTRWALFVDCDVMARGSVARLFEEVEQNPGFAVYVVKHDHTPPEGVKLEGKLQVNYARKNWSSVMLFDCDHIANRALTVSKINALPGRDLHRFCWLEDDQIGDLSPCWNHLVGYSEAQTSPKLVHFTSGVPTMSGYEDCDFAHEWRRWLRRFLGTAVGDTC